MTRSTSSYDLLLNLLADDEDEAADRYLLIRAKLTAYFEGRRISPAEDLADEVLHRVASKIGDGEEIRDINRYVYGVARFVMLEAFHQPEMQSIDDETVGLPSALTVAPDIGTNDDEDVGPMQGCLNECLQNLRVDHRRLLLAYYEVDETRGNHIVQRRKIAEQNGQTPGALQKQICLLRKKVSECFHDCVKTKLA